MYKATNIDTDKALKAIEAFRRSQSTDIRKNYTAFRNTMRDLKKA